VGNTDIYIDFNSLNVVGVNYNEIKYRIAQHSGFLKDGRKIEYIKKYGK
jgi:hypothetical protein